MNVHAAVELEKTGLTRPNGDPLRLNRRDFVAIDRDRNAKYEATYRPLIYRVIRGTAEFKDSAGKTFDLAAGDVVTAGKNSTSLVGVGENTQILRLGLLKGMENLRSWTSMQRDEIDGLAGQIITKKAIRPLLQRRQAGRVLVRIKPA